MGETFNEAAKENNIHYENRVEHKERECNQHTSHHIGKTGSIRSRSYGRVSSRVHGGASPSGKSRHSSTKNHSKSPSRRSVAHSSRSHSGSRHHSTASGSGGSKCGGGGGGGGGNKTVTGRERCYDQKPRRRLPPCTKPPKWQKGKYVRDECGSGIVPKRFDFRPSQKIWCKTPLTMYQATIGELGRKILCRETVIPRNVRPEPPCNIAEYILPPCRGYYRKYDCMRPCEEDYVMRKQGKKVYRDRVERYWEPCLSKDEKHLLDINAYAGQNVALGIKVRRHNVDIPCW